jgi:hypothetical protein
MKCEEIQRKYSYELKLMMFEYCPACGVHAPWVNDCKEEEE